MNYLMVGSIQVSVSACAVSMTGILLPALAALERYFPDHGRIDAMPAALAPGNAKALVIEGDLVIDRNA
jgi:hypothetical protein